MENFGIFLFKLEYLFNMFFFNSVFNISMYSFSKVRSRQYWVEF